MKKSKEEKAEAKKAAKVAAQDAKLRSQGGQRQMRIVGAAEVYDVVGPDRTRATPIDRPAMTIGILDKRLNLTAQERAIGNCYGAYFQAAHTGGSTEFLREYVDGGGVNGGGYSERQAHIVAMVVEAQAALSKMKAFKYSKPKPRKCSGKRKASKPGRYLPIHALQLIDAVCVHGHSIETVAIRFQWFMLEKQTPDQTWAESKLVTQWTPRRRIIDSVRLGLNHIGDAWDAAGMTVPYHFGTIEVE